MLLVYKDIVKGFNPLSVIDSRVAISMPLRGGNNINYYGDGNYIYRRSSRNLTSKTKQLFENSIFVCPTDCVSKYIPVSGNGNEYSANNCVFILSEKIVNGQFEMCMQPYKYYTFDKLKNLELVNILPHKGEKIGPMMGQLPQDVHAPPTCSCANQCQVELFRRPLDYSPSKVSNLDIRWHDCQL